MKIRAFRLTGIWLKAFVIAIDFSPNINWTMNG